MIKFNVKELTIKDIDFENLPQCPEEESGIYNIDLNIKNTNVSLLFDILVTDHRTYDAGDYYTAPSTDGVIEIEIPADLEFYNWDNDHSEFFTNEKLIDQLVDYLTDHYN